MTNHPMAYMRPLIAAFLAFAGAGAQTPNPSMLVSTDWLAQHLNDPKVVVLHVAHEPGDYRSGHIPGARQILYDDVAIDHNGIRNELPPVAQLRHTFERLGVSDDSYVVVYTANGMGPMASRVFLTLDHMGLPKIALLNGSIAKWRAEGRPISTEEPKITPGSLTPRPRTVTVDAAWVNAHTGARGFAFIDTRTTPEYLGTGSRSGLPSAGHIAGARQLEWQQLFSDSDVGTFLEPAELKKLFADRVTPGDTLVTYCLVGYRASMTYFGARLLGYPVRLYDGSYQEWARLNLPVKKGETP